ncbi:unnamed protein product [Sphenostylis stenocarpa]|uniref:Uncharacterized protein n=1 Tax=Sphenostylis stenocarpa TaxID=92480 RepID=A0AA86VBG8_9FABA|nr:unnamed protein product [Sphenostylis stenocarpa]
MAATRSQLCMLLVVVLFTSTTVLGQHTPCIIAETNCATNNDCDAACKLKVPKNLYCAGFNICDDGHPEHHFCCCRQIPHCPNQPFERNIRA